MKSRTQRSIAPKAAQQQRIEDYAMIGDCETVALVGRNGSIDWLCWPSFNSEACFARLLGTEQNGFWRIAPRAAILSTTRRYQDHTLILETTHTTRTGQVQVIDFMPPRDRHSRIVRMVKCLSGRVRMRGELMIRFGYGQSIPWVTHISGGICAVAGPDSVELHTDAPLEGEGLSTVSDFTLSGGETVAFTLINGRYGDYHESSLPLKAPAREHARTKEFWSKWVRKQTYAGKYSGMVERSLITLKALTYAQTGAVVAAPTTSLPEEIGGTRNWDYRYCWLRDATFTLRAFIYGGFHEEARDWTQWLRRTIAGSVDQIQVMYGIHGERRLQEYEVPALTGYRGSQPVRIGNAASAQLQIDVYGELLGVFALAFSELGPQHAIDFDVIRALMERLDKLWKQPDSGIWEVRGKPKHFTFSKIMAWVAYDRAIQIAEQGNFSAPLARWKRTRATIHQQVCERGFNKTRNSFMQHYGSSKLDASVLLIAHTGFLPPDDPRVVGTVEAIQRELMEDGLVMRYRPSRGTDGLSGGEGKFLACSFWLVGALRIIGRNGEAQVLFERLLGLANDVGLFSEEYDTERKSLVGNFPQAFSHIALIAAAHRLAAPASDK